MRCLTRSTHMWKSRDDVTRTRDSYVPNVVRYQLRYIPPQKTLPLLHAALKSKAFQEKQYKIKHFFCYGKTFIARIYIIATIKSARMPTAPFSHHPDTVANQTLQPLKKKYKKQKHFT